MPYAVAHRCANLRCSLSAVRCPLFTVHRPLPLRPVPFRPRQPVVVPRALRELAALVLCCLLLQALMLPAQRTAQRLHVHLAPLLALGWSAPAPTPFTEHGRRARDGHQGHGHAEAAAHAHQDEDGHDVVFLDSHDADTPASAATVIKRHLFDQDSAWAGPALLPAVMLAQAVTGDPPLRPFSHVQTPLERPPRAFG